MALRKQQDYPYLWAEASNYWYGNQIVARANGGALDKAPSLELLKDMGTGKEILPVGTKLKVVNIKRMVEKNRERIAILQQITVKRIYDYYKRKKNKMDCFHVAFSGGKDSIVLLDLIERALPKTSYMVVFGDTGMEFPDTYDVIDKVEAHCKNEGIEFYRAKSHLAPMESWKLFGPPSNVLRWCCTVHKAAPQTLKIREVLGKSDYVGVDFVGVRRDESLRRSEYDYESYGKKQKGQFSQNPILDWNSAEIWMYIYTQQLTINNAYKKGNSRAGCLFCPMGHGKSDYFRICSYPNEMEKYINYIASNVKDDNMSTYISNAGWINRKNGRDLIHPIKNYTEEIKEGYLYITIVNPSTDWREWIKTLGEIPFKYEMIETKTGYVIKVNAMYDKTAEMKYFKRVFHKAAACVQCRVCESNCRNGCISFENGLHIENCLHCMECHNISSGCLVYHSKVLPKGDGKMEKSINTFADHAPKMQWVHDFFEQMDEFFLDNTLGPMQIQMFRRFLADAELATRRKVQTTNFSKLIKSIGWETDKAWGLILIQLAYNNPQIRWYIKEMSVGNRFTQQELEDRLTALEIKQKDAKSIIKSYKRLVEIPLGTILKFGSVESKGRTIVYLKRDHAKITDDRVVLYALYRFAEACKGYYQFSLTRLMDFNVESDGISPAEIFGLSREEMEQFVNALSVRFPEFINATFTHDLEKISLREDKKSTDVLRLFEA